MTIVRKAEPQPRSEDVLRRSAVRIEHLTKSFGSATVVDDVSFEVPVGSFTGLLGPNGAGKTTLISMMSGLVPPTSGACAVMDHDVVRAKSDVQRALGVVPQDLAIYPELSALDNLSFFGAMYGLTGRVLRDRVGDALARVGLEDRAVRPAAGRFSGGQKRRLNIAAALMHRPEVLILDEPTVGVDPQSRNHIFATLRELHADGVTILYTSHYMEEVEALCDRVVIVDHGHVIEQGGLEHVLATHGRSIVQLRLTAEDAAAAEAYLRTVHGIEWKRDGDVVEIDSSELQGAVGVLTQLLRDVIPSPEECRILPPSLETVFIKLTGSRLRDE